jgi:hypothetical protein
MLSFFHILGQHLHRARFLLWVVIAGCLMTFAIAVFAMQGQPAQPWLMGSVVVLIWSISALSVALGFSGPLPHAADDQGFFVRLKVKLARMYLWIMALIMCLVSIGVIFLSIRAVAIVMRQ